MTPIRKRNTADGKHEPAGRVSDRTAFMYLGELIEFCEAEKISTKPGKQQTEDYISGRFG